MQTKKALQWGDGEEDIFQKHTMVTFWKVLGETLAYLCCIITGIALKNFIVGNSYYNKLEI